MSSILIGYIGAGTSNVGGSNQTYAARYQAPASATVGRIVFYSAHLWDETDKIRLGVYDDNAATPEPENLIAQTAEITGPVGGTSGWYAGTLETPLAITNGTWYWLSLIRDSATPTFRAAASGTHYLETDTFSDGFADPWQHEVFLGGTYKFLIYGTESAPPAADTLGYESIGGTSHSLTANQHLACQFTAGYTGIIYSVKAYIKNFASSEYARVTIYDNSLAAPPDAPGDNLMHSVEMGGTGVDGWVTFNLVQPIKITSGVTYWIGVHTPSAIDLVYDAGEFENYRIITDTYVGGCLETWSGGTNAIRKYSIHATQDVPSQRWIGYKDPKLDYDGDFIDGPGNDEIYLIRVLAIESLTITTIGIYLKSSFEAGHYAKAAVYSDNGTEVPQALLGESGEYQGDGTRKLYSMELASSVNFVAGAYYWIGYVYSGDDDYDTSIYGAWFDAWGSWAYDVGDTYSDGPDDPCNTPEEWDGSWGLAMFAEEAAGEAATTAQDGILFAIL